MNFGHYHWQLDKITKNFQFDQKFSQNILQELLVQTGSLLSKY